jgi:hypothetical protein
MMVWYGVSWLWTEVVSVLNPPPVLELIWILAFLLVCVGVGIYVGYRTRAPGWLTGGLPAMVQGVCIVLLNWILLDFFSWLMIAIFAVPVVLGMVGGWIGGRLRKRRLAKAQEADEAAGSESALGHMGDGLEGRSW